MTQLIDNADSTVPASPTRDFERITATQHSGVFFRMRAKSLESPSTPLQVNVAPRTPGSLPMIQPLSYKQSIVYMIQNIVFVVIGFVRSMC